MRGRYRSSRLRIVTAMLLALLSMPALRARAGDWAGDWACLRQGAWGDPYSGPDLSCTMFTGGPKAGSPHNGWVPSQTARLADPWLSPIYSTGIMPTAGNDYDNIRRPAPSGNQPPTYGSQPPADGNQPAPYGNPQDVYLQMSAESGNPAEQPVMPPEFQSPPLAAPGFVDGTEGSLLDNLSFFAGIDGSKQPQDYGVNAQLGGRVALNFGLPVQEEWGLGIQAGTAFNFSSAAVDVLPRVANEDQRNQYFTTLGVFQRSPWGINWSIAYDFLWEDYYDRFQFGQWRGRVGLQLTECEEFGVWFTKRDRGDSGTLLGIPTYLQPISQVNAFWRHTWFGSAWTTVWVGAAQQHGRVVLGLPDYAPIKTPFSYGADLNIPLNNWLSIWGEANFITPASSGTVDAYLGFAIYPGGGARRSLQNCFQPLLPVANNNSFAIDLAR